MDAATRTLLVGGVSVPAFGLVRGIPMAAAVLVAGPAILLYGVFAAFPGGT